jgi:hypothetical protein
MPSAVATLLFDVRERTRTQLVSLSLAISICICPSTAHAIFITIGFFPGSIHNRPVIIRPIIPRLPVQISNEAKTRTIHETNEYGDGPNLSPWAM